MPCLFKFCSAKEHSVINCKINAQEFFSKAYYGTTYNVCPKCRTASTLNFEDFLQDHGDHLSFFSKSKLEIIKNGKIFIYHIIYFLTYCLAIETDSVIKERKPTFCSVPVSITMEENKRNFIVI